MQSVAEEAGFATSAKAGNRPDTDAQVLKVEHPTDGEDGNNFIDDILAGKDVDLSGYKAEDYAMPQKESEPPSRQASAGPGSTRSRQQGYY
jgi:hypothetical protein